MMWFLATGPIFSSKIFFLHTLEDLRAEWTLHQLDFRWTRMFCGAGWVDSTSTASRGQHSHGQQTANTTQTGFSNFTSLYQRRYLGFCVKAPILKTFLIVHRGFMQCIPVYITCSPRNQVLHVDKSQATWLNGYWSLLPSLAYPKYFKILIISVWMRRSQCDISIRY